METYDNRMPFEQLQNRLKRDGIWDVKFLEVTERKTNRFCTKEYAVQFLAIQYPSGKIYTYRLNRQGKVQRSSLPAIESDFLELKEINPNA